MLILFYETTSLAAVHRVIALSPALTELIFAMNMQDRLVGVSDFCDFPQAAKKLPSVGPYTKPNLEKIISLKPDRVLLPQEGPQDVQSHFDQFKIPYTVITMRTLNQIGEAAVQVGQALEQPQKGRNFEKQWSRQVKEEFGKNPKSKTAPRIFIEIQSEPLIVAGRDTFLDEIAERCGAENIFKNKGGYPRVSLESLTQNKIDMVFIADFFSSDLEKAAVLKRWKGFPPTEESAVVVLDPDIAARPGPRLISGIATICNAVSRWSHDRK